MPGLPDVPTFAELGYHSYEPYGWFGVFLPAGAPAAITINLADEVERFLRLPDVTDDAPSPARGHARTAGLETGLRHDEIVVLLLQPRSR